MRWLLLLCTAAAAGCVSAPDPEPAAALPAEPAPRRVMVQTIPRGAWVERDHEYLGVAPLEVEVPVRANGHARRITVIRVQDASGAWERKILSPAAPVPERMLFDLRGLSDFQPGLSWR